MNQNTANEASEPTPTLFDAIKAFARATDIKPSSIEALVGRRGSAAVEGAAEVGVEEILCEEGFGNCVAATLTEFRIAGSPTRARYLSVMRRLAEHFVQQA